MNYLTFGLLGLLIGSFISAFTYRYPRGKNFFSGRSRCDSCNAEISWYDNIPLLSYLLLKGKCRNCKREISIRYPIIELGTAATFVIAFLFLPNFLFFLFIFSLLICVFVIDVEHQIIPDSLVFILIFLGVLYLAVFAPNEGYTRLGTSFLIASFFLIIHLVTRGHGMGLGDVKFALFPPLLLGWPLSFVWLFGSFLIGAITGIILIFLGKASFGKKIAFGPFLVISLYITLIFGNYISEIFF